MIAIDRTWFDTPSQEAIENEKCPKSYSEEHSFIPVAKGMKCVHCGKSFKDTKPQ